MQVIYDPDEQRVPIMAWLDEIDEGTLEQSRNLARLPFATHHVALMPDAHRPLPSATRVQKLLSCQNPSALLRMSHAVP